MAAALLPDPLWDLVEPMRLLGSLPEGQALDISLHYGAYEDLSIWNASSKSSATPLGGRPSSDSEGTFGSST
jgi:hypothetical protein